MDENLRVVDKRLDHFGELLGGSPGEKGADVGKNGKGQIVLRLPRLRRYHIGIWFLFSGSKVLASTAFFPFS